MTKSDNTQGNPWHGDDGKFTSPDAVSLGVSEEDFNNYLSSLGSGSELKIKSGAGALLKSQLKLKAGAGALLKGLQKDTIQSMPVSRQTEDVVNNIYTSINKEYVSDVLQYYNVNAKYSDERACPAFYSFKDKYGYIQKRRCNVFIQTLINKRFPKKANPISQEEYDAKVNIVRTQGSGQLNAGYNENFEGRTGDKFLQVPGFSFSATHGSRAWNRNYVESNVQDTMTDNLDRPDLRDLGCGMIVAYRGLDLDTDNATISDLKRSYVGQGTADPVMSLSGNSGTTHYISMQWDYAHGSYGYGKKDNTLKMIINAKDANIITRGQLDSMRRRVYQEASKSEYKIEENFHKALLESGRVDGSETRDLARKMTDDYLDALKNDNGLVAALAGVQMLFAEPNNGSQCDLYDLSIADMLVDF